MDDCVIEEKMSRDKILLTFQLYIVSFIYTYPIIHLLLHSMMSVHLLIIVFDHLVNINRDYRFQ